MESAFRYRQGHPSPDATVEGHTCALNPAHLEALDPSRAPLKYLTTILTEYRAEDGTYLSLLDGLQYPLERKKIVERLSDERLVLHDPFIAAMGLVLLSRLGVS
jgi:hypothetical protein